MSFCSFWPGLAWAQTGFEFGFDLLMAFYTRVLYRAQLWHAHWLYCWGWFGGTLTFGYWVDLVTTSFILWCEVGFQLVANCC